MVHKVLAEQPRADGNKNYMIQTREPGRNLWVGSDQLDESKFKGIIEQTNLFNLRESQRLLIDNEKSYKKLAKSHQKQRQLSWQQKNRHYPRLKLTNRPNPRSWIERRFSGMEKPPPGVRVSRKKVIKESGFKRMRSKGFRSVLSKKVWDIKIDKKQKEREEYRLLLRDEEMKRKRTEMQVKATECARDYQKRSGAESQADMIRRQEEEKAGLKADLYDVFGSDHDQAESDEETDSHRKKSSNSNGKEEMDI